ncbi:NADP-dependent 3-hydroxy acid dehydrogenase YdfG [Raoultella sp. BIGb0138]|uniref:oxidoreductase n=1 Tax=Raoultella sp. BIGb0138 TaxID=2485115 RepID=UPI00104D2D55|nr:oxidoreductase [Raoultella sp. BIGb0138]TCW04023.1 NADP-dependent 3-hydroxy acid dehydrogenase YdfG [Raoultella sp. BIGb0138]
MSKLWFITGVSSGLGKAIAQAALQAGHRVVGTLRTEEQRQAFADLLPGRAYGVLLDVTDDAAVESTVARIEREVGPVEVLVNNAGYGVEGAVEETSMAQSRHQFEVNFFGALAVTKAVLPGMRERRQGHIINITSTGGLMAFPGLGVYNASKHALEGLTDALAQEVKNLGIKVTAIEPGPFRTDWAGRSMARAETRIDDYQATAGAMREALAQRNGKQAGDPARAGAILVDLVKQENPPRRLVLGTMGYKQIGGNLSARLAELVNHADISLSADFPLGE